MDRNADEFLAHYGVKGMKWGKRKGKTTSTSGPDSEDHTKSRELLSKPKRELSNKEIESLNRRLQLERSYKDLTKNQGSLAKGQSYAKNGLAVMSTANQIVSFVNSPTGKLIKSIFA